MKSITRLRRSKRISLIYCVGALMCLGLFGGNSIIKGQTRIHQSQQKMTENKRSNLNKKESPFTCNMAALKADQRTHTFSLLDKLKTKIQKVNELPDGFALRFPTDTEMVKDVAEFITYERLCCPFLDFGLVVKREGGPLWLRLKGCEGVKDFIHMEFGL